MLSWPRACRQASQKQSADLAHVFPSLQTAATRPGDLLCPGVVVCVCLLVFSSLTTPLEAEVWQPSLLELGFVMNHRHTCTWDFVFT